MRDVDVLFLDIQMPGLTGFDVLERLERDLPVIFTTAYDRYALDAFTVNSIDYLLKPIESERLERALDKLDALRRAAAAGCAGAGARARRAARRPAGGSSASPRGSASGRRSLDVARISHFFSKDKLTFAVSAGREHAIDYTLAELEGRLDPRRFVRIHRATIANLAFVAELYPGVDGMLIRLKDDRKTELSVARDRVRDLKDRLGI